MPNKTNHIGSPASARFLIAIPRWIGGLVALVGTLVLVGWIFDLRFVVGINARFATMKFNTAFLFAVAGITLLSGQQQRKRYAVGGSFIAVLSLLTLCQSAFAINIGIDEWLIKDQISREIGSAYPGRMSTGTAINFLVYGLGCVLLYYGNKAAQYLALVMSLMAMLAIAGYLYDVSDLYNVFLFSTMAPHTALGFLLLSIGLFFSITKSSPARLFLSNSSGGYIMRNLLPLIILVFLLTGLLWHSGHRLGFYGTGFAEALTIVSNIVVVTLLTWWTARRIHRVEAEVRSSQKRLQTILEEAGQGILLVNQNGHIIQANAFMQQMFRMERDELLGQSVDILLPLDRRAVHSRLRADYMENPAARAMGTVYDLQARKKDGAVFPVDVSLSPIHLDGETHIVVFVVDTTERLELTRKSEKIHELEIELEKERELQALKSRVVVTVSHEFRTPLAIINSSIDIVKRYAGKLSKADIDSKLDRASIQIKHMDKMLAEILDLERIETGSVKFAPDRIDMPAFVRKIVDDVDSEDMRGHHIDLSVGCGYLVADPNLLAQILTYLIANAQKYSPAGSTIQVQAAPNENEWRFTVQDHGIGIPEANLNGIFSAFFRADNAHNQPGTGLGLAIVKNYVDLHGGSIEITSTEGQGTTVHVIIPDIC